MNRVILFIPLLYGSTNSIDCPLVIDIATKLNVGVWDAVKMNSILINCCGANTGVVCVNDRVEEINWNSGVSVVNATLTNVTFPSEMRIFKIPFFGATGQLPKLPTRLKVLDIAYNMFDGPLVLPNQVESAALSFNSFNGSFPLLPLSLIEFLAPGNKFTGDINMMANSPTLPSNLQVFVANYNTLSGNVPYLRESLREFSCRECGFTSYFSNFTIPSSLRLLDLARNQLSGPMLNFTNTSLTTLELSDNDLTGSISGLPESLLVLNLQGNRLSGQIGVLPPNLTTLLLRDNLLYGSFPDYGRMTTIDLSNNHYTGSLPEFTPIIQNFDVTNNLLNGTVPPFPQSLRSLDLSNNSFSGAVPTLPSNPTFLNVRIDNNQFTSFETSLMNVTYLHAFNNNISGSIIIGNMPVRRLYVQNNFITNLVILNQADLLGCDYSNNPLKHLPVISNKCTRNNLYYPDGYSLANISTTTELNYSTSSTDLNKMTTMWSTKTHSSSVSVLINQLKTRARQQLTTEFNSFQITATNTILHIETLVITTQSIPIEYVSYNVPLFTLKITLWTILRCLPSFVTLLVILCKLYKRQKKKHHKHTQIQQLTLSND